MARLDPQLKEAGGILAGSGVGLFEGVAGFAGPNGNVVGPGSEVTFEEVEAGLAIGFDCEAEDPRLEGNLISQIG